jgi:hypothetical protein
LTTEDLFPGQRLRIPYSDQFGPNKFLYHKEDNDLKNSISKISNIIDDKLEIDSNNSGDNEIEFDCRTPNTKLKNPMAKKSFK